MAQRRVIGFSIEGFMYSLRIFIFALFLFLISCSPEHSRFDGVGSSDGTGPQGFDASTEKYYAGCVDQYKGRWSFGLSPYGCAMPPGDEKRATAQYKAYSILLSDRKNAEEKTRFVQLFHDFIINTAKEYLERREPEVHPKDLSAWLQLVLVTA
ncbi:MAG: hypothetical protein HRT44_12570, partial [Bdellovibrionales bacterium]|nr:hypothetical protein [Bdellovibrionales bacterium]NQZ20072.1 hypothetical protein [Bdellovibrionales bacterium]